MWGALHGLQDPRKAIFAEAAVLDVDPFHRVGGSHGAAIVVAMGKAQRVSQFVHGFDQETIGQEICIGWQTIKFLPQTMIRNYRCVPTELGLPKNESQDWNIEIQLRDADQAPGAAVDVSLHPGQDFGGVILLAFGVARERGIDGWPHDLGRHTKFMVKLLPQPIEQRSICGPHRQKL